MKLTDPDDEDYQAELEKYNASKQQLEQLRADNLAFFDQKQGKTRRNRGNKV